MRNLRETCSNCFQGDDLNTMLANKDKEISVFMKSFISCIQARADLNTMRANKDKEISVLKKKLHQLHKHGA